MSTHEPDVQKASRGLQQPSHFQSQEFSHWPLWLTNGSFETVTVSPFEDL